MPRHATGNAYLSAGTWYARVTIGKGARRSFALSTCRTEEEARARADVLAELAAKLRPLEQPALAARALEDAAASEESALANVRRSVDRLLAAGLARPNGEPAPVTFKEHAERWISGELAAEHPDRVRVCRSTASVQSKLNRYIYPLLGDIPLAALTLDDAERVLSNLPAHLSRGSRRAIAGYIGRIMRLAAYPCKLIPSSPIPAGFLPAKGSPRARGWLYPSEDKDLLACTGIPLAYRILYGFLAREGMRKSEAAQLQWCDVDLERGAVNLERNKTDSPRLWAMDPGVVRALLAWRKLRGEPDGAEHVFAPTGGIAIDFHELAQRLREHLAGAKVVRPELFESSSTRQRMRAHDLRATFITLNLAAGRTEAWISDRTGHCSSNQIQGYRRAARTAEELNLGSLGPLDAAIPELRSSAPGKPGSAPGEGEGAKEKARERARRRRSPEKTRGADSIRVHVAPRRRRGVALIRSRP